MTKPAIIASGIGAIVLAIILVAVEISTIATNAVDTRYLVIKIIGVIAANSIIASLIEGFFVWVLKRKFRIELFFLYYLLLILVSLLVRITEQQKEKVQPDSLLLSREYAKKGNQALKFLKKIENQSDTTAIVISPVDGLEVLLTPVTTEQVWNYDFVDGNTKLTEIVDYDYTFKLVSDSLVNIRTDDYDQLNDFTIKYDRFIRRESDPKIENTHADVFEMRTVNNTSLYMLLIYEGEQISSIQVTDYQTKMIAYYVRGIDVSDRKEFKKID